MARVTVREIEYALGKPVSKSGKERLYRCTMPECSDHDKPTLYINVSKQTFFCLRCEIGRGRKLPGIWEALGLECPPKGELDHYEEEEKAKRKKRPKTVPAEHAKCLHSLGSQPGHPHLDPLAHAAWTYLIRERGLSIKVIRRAHLCVGTGDWAGYILFPLHDSIKRENLVYFSGRAYVPAAFPPQRNPPNGIFPIDAGEAVYGSDRAQALGWGVLSEAPLDALKVNEFAMATYGKGVTDAQKNRICSLGLRKLVIYFDADAQEKAWDLALELAPRFRGGCWVAVPPGKDPGACTYEQNAAAVAGAVLVTDRSYAEFRLTKRLRSA